MEQISDLQKLGRRLNSLHSLIKKDFPKDIWIMDGIHISFVKLIQTG